MAFAGIGAVRVIVALRRSAAARTTAATGMLLTRSWAVAADRLRTGSVNVTRAAALAGTISAPRRGASVAFGATRSVTTAQRLKAAALKTANGPAWLAPSPSVAVM